jgi:hypothetical protein
MCLFFIILLAGPRIGIFLWWLLEPARWDASFPSFVVPVLGFLLLPWTTLAWVSVYPGGVSWWDWALVGLAFLLDLATSGGSYRGRR